MKQKQAETLIGIYEFEKPNEISIEQLKMSDFSGWRKKHICKNCGKEIRHRKSSAIYCKECVPIKEKEYAYFQRHKKEILIE